MDVSEAVARRISVRAFKPDPVPGTVVREILEAAKSAREGRTRILAALTKASASNSVQRLL